MHFARRRNQTATLILCLLSMSVFGQGRLTTQYSAEAGAYFSSSTATPFWLRANQYGIVPNQSPAYTLRVGLYGDSDTTGTGVGRWRNTRFAVGYGLNVVANAGPNRLAYEKSVLLP